MTDRLWLLPCPSTFYISWHKRDRWGENISLATAQLTPHSKATSTYLGGHRPRDRYPDRSYIRVCTFPQVFQE